MTVARSAHLFPRLVVVVYVAEVVVVVAQVVGRVLVVGVLYVRSGVVVLGPPDGDTVRLDGNDERRAARHQHAAGTQAQARAHGLHRVAE